MSSVTVNVNLPGATLRLPAYAGNQFQFTVVGASNLNHVVQGSSNLTNWVSLHTNYSTFTFTDTSVNTARFYRVLSVPSSP
jgi:hypothetical protein